jgi:hypothetical protein
VKRVKTRKDVVLENLTWTRLDGEQIATSGRSPATLSAGTFRVNADQSRGRRRGTVGAHGRSGAERD